MMLKTQYEQLAIAGGSPAFHESLHVGRPNLGDQQKFFARMEDVFARRWLTNQGRYLTEFEDRVAQLTGARHCVAVCNATIGLQIALKAAGVTGSVIIPSFTFVATAHAAAWLGLRPILCDVDPQTHQMDPHQIESLLRPDTTAILGVHVWGETCDVTALETIARRHRLRLIFDAAHAFGCSHQGRMVGSLGAAEVFSFHATKFINTFEGGAICTQDDALAMRARQIRDFGFSHQDEVVCLGTNGKLNEASAAMGLTNLEMMDRFIEVNRANYEAYRAGLYNLPGIKLYPYNEREARNFQYVPVEIDDLECPLSRDEIRQALVAENVLARRYFYPGLHRCEPYASDPSATSQPVTDRLSQRMLLLPTGTAVTDETIAEICHLIRLIVASGAQIRRLNTRVDAVEGPAKPAGRQDRRARPAKAVRLAPLRAEG